LNFKETSSILEGPWGEAPGTFYAMPLEIDYPERTDVSVIRPISENLDHESSAEIKTLLVDLIAAHKIHVVLDLENVETIRSPGLGVLISGMKSLRKNGGDLKLCGVRDNVKEILEVTRVSEALQIFDDLESAVRSFAGE
jgi:anti-sigma B factor antagonist